MYRLEHLLLLMYLLCCNKNTVKSFLQFESESEVGKIDKHYLKYISKRINIRITVLTIIHFGKVLFKKNILSVASRGL